MIPTSDLYKELLPLPGTVKETRIVIDDTGDIYNIDRKNSVYVRRNSFGNGTPTVGTCVSSECNFVIRDYNAIPRMAKIILYIRLVNGERSSEWIKKGEFFIATRRANEEAGTLTVTAYDAMLKTEQFFSDLTGWPKRDINLVEAVCSQINVELDSRTREIITSGFTLPSPAKYYTLREYLGYIGMMYGGNWIITPEGKLRLILLKAPVGPETVYLSDENGKFLVFGDTKIIVERSSGAEPEENTGYFDIGWSIKQFDKYEPFSTYTGVRFVAGTDDTGNQIAFFAGDTTGQVLEVEFPLATQAMVNKCYDTVKGYAYKPYSAMGAIIDPAAEIGDIVTIKERVFSIPSMEENYSSLYTATLTAPNDEELSNEYPHQSPLKRQIKREVSDQIMDLDENLEEFTVPLQGDVANIAVDRLFTSRRIPRYLRQDTSDDNYIKIQDQSAQWITGSTTGATEQAKNMVGLPLYWEQDISGASLDVSGWPTIGGKAVNAVTTVTEWPVTVYAYTELVKRAISFVEDGGVYNPVDIFGAGDGTGKNQARIDKTQNGLQFLFTNAAGERQGMVMYNTGGVELPGALWFGTEAEYEALTPNPYTVYFTEEEE